MYESGDKDDIQRGYNSLFASYKEIYKTSIDRNLKVNDNIKIIKKHYLDNIEISDIITKVFSVGKKLSEKVSNFPINNISDLKIVYHKINYLRMVSEADDFNIEYLDDAFRSLAADVDGAIYYFDKIDRSDRKKMAIKSLENIERYIESIFK